MTASSWRSATRVWWTSTSCWPSVSAHLGRAVPAIGTGQAWARSSCFTDPDPGRARRCHSAWSACTFPLPPAPAPSSSSACCVGIVPAGASQAQAMDWLVAALQEICAAAPHGVRLALEPINRYETTLVNTVAEGLALLDRVGAANMGLLLDTFHMNIEDPSPTESAPPLRRPHLSLSRGRLEPLVSRRRPHRLCGRAPRPAGHQLSGLCLWRVHAPGRMATPPPSGPSPICASSASSFFNPLNEGRPCLGPRWRSPTLPAYALCQKCDTNGAAMRPRRGGRHLAESGL